MRPDQGTPVAPVIGEQAGADRGRQFRIVQRDLAAVAPAAGLPRRGGGDLDPSARSRGLSAFAPVRPVSGAKRRLWACGASVATSPWPPRSIVVRPPLLAPPFSLSAISSHDLRDLFDGQI
jgi:hypothetical protein